MTKLDLVLERIRKLPQEQQDALADEIDFLLEDARDGSLLSATQWREVEAELSKRDEPTSSHEEVFARLDANNG